MNIRNTKRRMSGTNTNKEHLQYKKRDGSKEDCFKPMPIFRPMTKFMDPRHPRQNFMSRRHPQFD